MTAEEAARRIEELRRVYDQGFLPEGSFEAMKRDIESRVRGGSPNKHTR